MFLQSRESLDILRAHQIFDYGIPEAKMLIYWLTQMLTGQEVWMIEKVLVDVHIT